MNDFYRLLRSAFAEAREDHDNGTCNPATCRICESEEMRAELIAERRQAERDMHDYVYGDEG